MDETRIDAAPTPAHIFAYRAFRSVFVRSPESSPVRPPPAETQDPNDDKENARHAIPRGSRFVTSPVRTKRDAELASETLNLSLTPKRQCVNPVSPTKSILKKSNVPTPRRAGLREATVTFKDIRMSVSPELARRGSPMRVRSQPDLRNTLVSLSSVGLSAPVLRPTSTSRAESKQAVAKEEINSQAHAEFDLDGYIAQTEKEMRRLIKYGQKWREHAKRQDEENARLRTQLEGLQEENDRLKRKDNNVSDPARLSISMDITRPSIEAVTDAEETKSKSRSSKHDDHVRRASQEKWKIPLDIVDHKKQRPKSDNITERSQKHHETRADIINIRHKSYKQAESKRRPEKDTINKSPELLPYEMKPPQWKEHRPSKENQHNEVNPTPESIKSIPPSIPTSEEDRKAAARERLRLKREAKVASVRASSAPSMQAINFGHDAKGDNEESQVDWMAIA